MPTVEESLSGIRSGGRAPAGSIEDSLTQIRASTARLPPPMVVPAASPESDDLYRQGLVSFLDKDEDAALNLWDQAVKIDPNNLKAVRGVERIRMRRSAVAPTSDDSKDLYRRGLEAFLSDQKGLALNLSDKAFAADSDNLEAKRLSERLRMKGEAPVPSIEDSLARLRAGEPIGRPG